MSSIHECPTVHCPRERARMIVISAGERVQAPWMSAGRLLDAFLAEHRSAPDRDARITLHAGDVARRARLSVEPDGNDRAPHLRVHWGADAGGPFPALDGRIIVQSDPDPGAFRLHLTGEYDPPLGFAGELFDERIGKRIASACAYGLLADIRSGVERHALADARVAHG